MYTSGTCIYSYEFVHFGEDTRQCHVSAISHFRSQSIVHLCQTVSGGTG